MGLTTVLHLPEFDLVVAQSDEEAAGVAECDGLDCGGVAVGHAPIAWKGFGVLFDCGQHAVSLFQDLLDFHVFYLGFTHFLVQFFNEID